MNTHIARQLLSNMPDEVFSIYIEPLIQLHGWPFVSLDYAPSPATNFWERMFDRHRLKVIARLTWERQEFPFSLAIFYPTSQARITGIRDTHVYGMDTRFADVINGRERFNRALTYIATTGRMPKPVVLMKLLGGLRILDGNHRLAAMATIPNSSDCIVDCWIGSL